MAHECPGNTGFFSLTPPDAKIPDGRSGPWAWLEGDDLVYDSGDNTAVSYTHLDVYKRQPLIFTLLA